MCKNDEGEILCEIDYNLVKQENAVKILEELTICYKRKSLKEWLIKSNISLYTRKEVPFSWIKENIIGIKKE